MGKTPFPQILMRGSIDDMPGGAELADFKRLSGGANLRGGIGLKTRSKNRSKNYNLFIMQIRGILSS